MFLPAQEAEERKFHRFVNITTLKNLCEHKDEIRQAVGLVALFIYSTVPQSQVCWNPWVSAESSSELWRLHSALGRGGLCSQLSVIKRIETQDRIFFDGMCNYSDVQKKVIPAL